MKKGEYYRHERSTRQFARKMLVIALGFPVSIVSMMIYFGGSQYSSEDLWTVAGVASLVSIFLLLVTVIPNYRKNGVLRYVVDSSSVRCESPDADSYEVQLADIVGLKQVKSMAGRMSVEDYIETVDGSVYKIPHNYDLNIHRVKKAIQAARPEIRRDSKVRY